jgi:hypothetical protein
MSRLVIHLSSIDKVTSDDFSIMPRNGVLNNFDVKFRASSHLGRNNFVFFDYN